ncbi:MAG: hypothetical protein AB4080_08865 [Trichodesmium sp.]
MKVVQKKRWVGRYLYYIYPTFDLSQESDEREILSINTQLLTPLDHYNCLLSPIVDTTFCRA